MAMPVFAKLGVIYNDTSYFHRMYEMYAFTKYKHGDNGLYNPAEDYGGGIKILIRLTKNPMVKIVTGAVAMVGW